jgi:hypothetical protein
MTSSIIRLANSTPAVRVGFLAAGLTIFSVAVLQSVAIVLAWIASGSL